MINFNKKDMQLMKMRVFEERIARESMSKMKNKMLDRQFILSYLSDKGIEGNQAETIYNHYLMYSNFMLIVNELRDEMFTLSSEGVCKYFDSEDEKEIEGLYDDTLMLIDQSFLKK